MHQYDAATARGEAVASDHGHTLSTWYPVDERLHASMCEDCGLMVLVARTAYEERWRTGGTAFEQGCLQEEEQSLL